MTHLDAKPQIIKDIAKPFYTAIVCIKDPEMYREACKKMRYFELEKKPCRALPFDRQLLGGGNNRERLSTHNVFVKLPRNASKVVGHRELESLFKVCGNIRSLKVSLNPDHSSRGYGFICFEDELGAKKALDVKLDINGQVDEDKDHEAFMVAKFQPREGKQML